MSTISDFVLTILGGVSIFVLGQIVIKFIVEPLYEQSKAIGQIVDSLIYYIDAKKGEKFKKINSTEAPIVLRQRASALMEKTYAIPIYELWEYFGIVPERKSIVEALQELIVLSNGVDNSSLNRIEKIAKYLKIDILSESLNKK